MPEAHRPNPRGRNPADSGAGAAKAALRAQLAAARRSVEPEDAARRRTSAALTISHGHRTIALYCSVGDEPDTWSLIDALFAGGSTLLLPLLGRRPDGTVRREPDWAVYAGRDELRTGYAGIAEPTGGGIGADVLRSASLVWCSALAATPSGDRLGTGGGWYDRALRYAAPDALIGVLLRDREVLDVLPVEPFDRAVDLIVTESRTIRTIRAAAPE